MQEGRSTETSHHFARPDERAHLEAILKSRKPLGKSARELCSRRVSLTTLEPPTNLHVTKRDEKCQLPKSEPAPGNVSRRSLWFTGDVWER